ncbi:thermonuclease family protein [Tsuneonella sp. HG222]
MDQRFKPCGAGRRITCVVDGDTIWLRGEKIRLADINAPEVSKPGCAREAALGRRAALRLTALLNQEDFALAPITDGTGRERDFYGRALRVVMRDGESLGSALVSEGLAEGWRGRRSSWCGS